LRTIPKRSGGHANDFGGMDVGADGGEDSDELARGASGRV